MHVITLFTQKWEHCIYCKFITFGDVFVLESLAVVSIRQIKHIAKFAFINV